MPNGFSADGLIIAFSVSFAVDFLRMKTIKQTHFPSLLFVEGNAIAFTWSFGAFFAGTPANG